MTKPNILFIFTDQHRLSAVGCYGETPCQTPNIDKLADEGYRFETAYTVFPVCSPARGTIMTGVYPHTHGICSNTHNLGCSIHELEDRPQLLSRQMEQAGYDCGYTGKWHLGSKQTETFQGSNKPSLPKDVGFKGHNFPGHGGGGFEYPEYKQYLADNNWTHEVYKVDDTPYPVMPYGILKGPEESTVPHFLTDNTISMIDESKAADKPFFIWHNFWGPHEPYFAPQAYYDLYKDQEMPVWPNYDYDSRGQNAPMQVKIHPKKEELSWDDWAEAIRHYYAFTTFIDHQIGRMIDHLKATGLYEDTIIIFTADHGETCGSHGALTDKGWHHFEEIHRVPFVVRIPEKYRGTIQPGTVMEEWVSLADVFPTILDFAGIDYSDIECHGMSTVPLLKGKKVQWRDKIVIEFTGVNSASASMLTIRKGDLKYGWNCSNSDELYDLGQDPHEVKNLINDPDYKEQLREIREDLVEWMEETKCQMRGVFNRLS